MEPELFSQPVGGGGRLYESNTVEGLAEQFGIDPKDLADAVSKYNDAVDEATETTSSLLPVKTGKAFKLDTPPFVGTPIVNGAAMSFGGILLNKNAQALDLDGVPIPGLYAAGRVTGGLFANGYVGDEAHGAAVGEAGTVGKIAADRIAQL
ncbi:MAG: FAD-binding protein [Eggerthellaceae bacterium]|nr:FAD-binding protein [Eggerthellaceae bacterium]